MRKVLAEQAAELLAGLGDTPDEIAAMLRGAGYKGERMNATECPCGSCLRDHLGQSIWVRVTGEVGTKDPNHDIGLASYRPLEPHVTRFVNNFDHGDYPDLIAGASTKETKE